MGVQVRVRNVDPLQRVFVADVGNAQVDVATAPHARGLELRHEKPSRQGKPDQIKRKSIGQMIPGKLPIQ